jgi:D-serine deaminase-like pyridoxal phosphate-dependent protein
VSPADGPGGPPGPADLARYNAATAGLEPAFAVIDLAALRANAADMTRRAAGKPIRLASKSVRCRALLEQVLGTSGFRGILAFTLPEALWLAGQGVSDDIVVAYPSTDHAALTRLASYPAAAAAITVMIDSPDHLDIIEKAVAAVTNPAPIQVCLDIDTSYVGSGGMIRAGARRSPVRNPAQAAAMARDIASRPGIRLAGLMAYEAQIAGVGDKPPGRPLYALAVRQMQRRSAAELAERRAAIVAAVREVTPLRFVNGGGTGSIEGTTAEDAVTEIGAGSGLYQPSLFDSYRAFSGRPAALFALSVVRQPAPAVVTVAGGGYVASGPAHGSRLPRPYLPAGLRLDKQEGAGEVQTPLLGKAAEGLRIGDRVWFRHAKAGELCERFGELHLIDGDKVTTTVPTYRGEGQSFG